MLRRETVEAAAPHEEDQVDQHIALGAQFALVSGLTHDARARKAAPVAKAREGDLDRKSVVKGKSVSVRVDLGGRRIIKKKNKLNTYGAQQDNTRKRRHQQ